VALRDGTSPPIRQGHNRSPCDVKREKAEVRFRSGKHLGFRDMARCANKPASAFSSVISDALIDCQPVESFDIPLDASAALHGRPSPSLMRGAREKVRRMSIFRLANRQSEEGFMLGLARRQARPLACILNAFHARER